MAFLKEETGRFLEAWMRVRQIVQAANFNRFHRAGLSVTQFMTLNVVPQQGLTLSELSRKLNLSPASLKKTIDSLEERGLVLRQPSSSDARKITILSTSKGRKLQNATSSEFHNSIASLFTAMSAHERRGLLIGLERMVELSGVSEAEVKRSESTLRADGAPRARRNIRRSPRS